MLFRRPFAEVLGLSFRYLTPRRAIPRTFFSSCFTGTTFVTLFGVFL